MTIKQFSAKQAEKNVALLETLLAEANIDKEKDWPECYGVSELVDNYLANSIFTVARYGNAVTLDEILEAEEERAGGIPNGTHLRALTIIHSLWVDKHAIINREDNLLLEAQKAAGAPEEESHHRVLLNLLQRGFVVSFTPNIFNWIDWKEVRKMDKGLDSPVVAAFNLREDEWEIDKGDESLTTEIRKGLRCTVMSEDGMFRRLRLEGNLLAAVEPAFISLHRVVPEIL